MSVVKVNKENINEVLNSEKTVLIDFYADWCGPCRMMGPVIDALAEEYPEYLIGKINVTDEEELAIKYGVSSIPTLMVVKNGSVTQKVSGLRSKQEVIALLNA